MMSLVVPTFTDRNEVSQADTCRHLSEAAQAGDIQLNTFARGHYPGRALPENTLPGLKSIGFWDAKKPQSWGLDWHRNEGIELALLERGTLDFAVEGHVHRLMPNDLTVTRPWQRHKLGSPNIGPGRLHWMILDLGIRRPHQGWQWPTWIMLSKNDLEELTYLLRHNEQPVWNDAAQVHECFARIAQIIEIEGSSSSVSWLTVLLNELLLQTLELLRSRNVALDESLSATQRTVELFLADLRYHLAEDWTVRRMAQVCGLGVTRFTDYCRRLTNTTPMQHLNQLRMEFAKQLLAERHGITNSDLAELCGFSSAKYFATAFRRSFGCSPQQFRVVAQEANA